MKYRHLFIFLFLYLWLMLGFRLSVLESPTFDEPIHLKAAIQYQKGDYDFDPIEPPLLRRTVYFFGQKIETVTGQSLTLFPYRAVVVILTGIALCFLLWPLFSHSLFAGLLASVLFVYEPNLIAHSHYFTTDALSALISVSAALLILKGYWKTKRQFLLLSFVFALAVSLKVATLALLLPVLLIKLPRLGKSRLIYLTLITLIIILITYNFHFGGYLRALKENILFAQRGQPIFFNEVLYQRSPWLKTPAVIFLKTSLPLLLLAGWGLVKGKNRKHLILIFLVTLAIGIFKPLNFGMRHLLPAEIVLVLLAAKVQPKSVLNWIVFTLLIIWQMVGFWRVMPQPLTYANELAREPYRIFTDSDFDWGQGLVELRSEIDRRQIGAFQLAYFGNNDPGRYLDNFVTKIDYQKPTIISVTCYYQCGYYRDPYFSQRPKEIIAKSFFYFP
ncbi:MAG: hypothetical protein AAB973_00060 [Patescibacteria group bacterium]